MAEEHEKLVSKYRISLIKKHYTINNKSPFVDYRPDIYAIKDREKIFVEVEIEQTLHSDHTLYQLEYMYSYLKKSRKYIGLVVVPNQIRSDAVFLIKSIFSDDKIKAIGLRI